jgi:hypothetical protein
LDKLFDEEEIYWQQRAKLKWFLEENNNTKFFHTTAITRKAKNYIFSLIINDITIYDPSILKYHVNSFYRDLLGTSSPKLISIHSTFWFSFDKLTLDQQNALEVPFTLPEIKHIIFLCNANKAFGPDDFSFLFYQSF